MHMSLNNDDTVGLFIEIAYGYCLWCESSSLGQNPEVSAALWLAKLYSSALTLPYVEDCGVYQPLNVEPALLERAKRNLAHFDGMYYQEYFDPDPGVDAASSLGDVGDDLFDTYQEIRSGLTLHENGQPTEAIWHWAFSHRIHWGRHAVGALFALHCLHISKNSENVL